MQRRYIVSKGIELPKYSSSSLSRDRVEVAYEIAIMKRVSVTYTSTIDLALLLLRVWFGLLLFVKHGLDKAINFSRTSAHFADPFHIGSTPSLLLVLLAEFVCALLVAVGLWTRVAAAIIVINLSVAFGFAHHFQLFVQ